MKLPFTTEASPSLNTDGGVKDFTDLVAALINLVSEPNWTRFNEVVSEVNNNSCWQELSVFGVHFQFIRVGRRIS